ncbi:sulfite exporter TauE/SafE family protein [Gammaproteobacteria bacterium AS21]
MDSSTLIILLLIIGFGTYVQTVIGFGLGMIVMGVVSFLALLPLTITSVVISLMAFCSGLMAIKGDFKALDIKAIIFICIGLIPSIALGLFILDFMSEQMAYLLQFILGAAIIVGAGASLLKPEPIKKVSHPIVFFIAGSVGGLLAGLFSVAGPPIIYQLYRQPLAMKTIRLSLLFVFLVSSFIRTAMVGAQGNLEIDMFLYALYCLPVAYFATWLGKNKPPPLSEKTMRKTAISLLIVIGLSLILKSYNHIF